MPGGGDPIGADHIGAGSARRVGAPIAIGLIDAAVPTDATLLRRGSAAKRLPTAQVPLPFVPPRLQTLIPCQTLHEQEAPP